MRKTLSLPPFARRSATDDRPWLLAAAATWFAIAASLTGVTGAAEKSHGHDRHPFVAAFDRLARHGELSPATGGQLLLTELSCTACHATDQDSLRPKSGPRLDGAGSRLQSDWMAEFLAAPSHIEPGTTMPDVLHGLAEDEKRKTIRALVAFLQAQQTEFPEIAAGGANPVPYRFWNKGDIDRGRSLYHSVGCVACHEADPEVEVNQVASSPVDELLEQLDPDQLEELGLASAARRVASVPHPELSDKYTRLSLTHFLLAPETVRPGGRMPDLQLAPVEAADIAAYLMHRQFRSSEADPLGPSAAGSGKADRIELGREKFQQHGCASCHDVAGVSDGTQAKPLAALDPGASRSCLQAPGPAQPQYRLTASQVDALGQLLSSDETSAPASAADALSLRLSQLNCFACHQRDSVGGVGRFRKPHFETVGHVDLGDEGRLPPPLSGVGNKLRGDWMKRVLDGKADLRPHMHIRMPRFPGAVTEPLPAWFAEVDRPQRESTADASHTAPFSVPAHAEITPEELADAGRALMDAGCVQCHSFRGYTLPGVVGVDLAGIEERVRPEWLYDFLLNPTELKPRTRMPTFFPDGKSQNDQVLGGDTELQLAAIWHYLKDLEDQPLPSKIDQARSQDYELDPTDQPILLRTFMKEAGTRAIAVGFPEDVHFAFDAEAVRPAVAWRGRFLDAQGTWFVRFAPPAEPLGEDLVTLPAGFPFTVHTDSAAARDERDAGAAPARYTGYRLDADRVPTFLYQWREFQIEDRIAPDASGGLQRRIVIRRNGDSQVTSRIALRALTGNSLDEDGPNVCRNNAGLHAKVDAPRAGEAIIQQNDDGQQWLVPIDVAAGENETTTLKVSYQW